MIYDFKEYITERWWELYATGCPCNGLPRYYKNDNFSEYKIVSQGGCMKLKRNGIQLFYTRDFETFKKKYNEIFTEN